MSDSTSTKRIPLHDLHEKLAGKLVPFAGFYMPVRYSSDIEEHNCVRQNVGVFDVSHMGEFIIKGPNALTLIQKVSANDASKLYDGKVQYSYLPNGRGGVVDDLLIYRKAADEYFVVVNASNIDKDWAWIQSQNDVGAEMHNISDAMSLFAVQGPNAIAVMQQLTDLDLASMDYYTFLEGTIAGFENVMISTTGYTGAGGFEVYVPNEHAEAMWNAIFEAGKDLNIKPIGLGARDTLRLEMGFCLYGNDIDDTTSPLEAGLGWVTKFTKPFIDSERLLEQKKVGLQRKLMGVELIDRGIPRSHYEVCDTEGNKIGEVTSGTMSPTMQKGIGMAYISTPHAVEGNQVYVKIREKLMPAMVTKFPFLK
jgi:aminomethyltransferase